MQDVEKTGRLQSATEKKVTDAKKVLNEDRLLAYYRLNLKFKYRNVW